MLDYIEFLESKYAIGLRSRTPFSDSPRESRTRCVRAGVPATAVAETMTLLNRAVGVSSAE